GWSRPIGASAGVVPGMIFSLGYNGGMANIFVFGPHPDDQEMGVGGGIAELVGEGDQGHLVGMTKRGPPAPRQPADGAGGSAAAKVLGVERTLVGLPNRQVVHSIEARHRVAAVIRKHKADWLFVPYPIDAHPDHVAVTRICEDARFDAKLTKTDIPGEPWYPK